MTFVLVKTLEPLVALSSEYEALRYGKFLGKLLKLLQHWKVRDSFNASVSDVRLRMSC